MAGKQSGAPAVRGVIMDMDGVILDTEPIYQAAWQEAAAALGFKVTAAMYQATLGMTSADGEARFRDMLGPAFPLERFRDAWPRVWRDRVTTGGIPVKKGLHRFLGLLDSLKIPAVVATSCDAENAALSLRAGGVEGRFAGIVTGDQVPHGKPAPDIFLKAAKLLGLAPGLCVVIEDSEAGVMAAAAAGIPAIMIPDLKPPTDAARAAAFRVVGSLDEMAGLISQWHSVSR